MKGRNEVEKKRGKNKREVNSQMAGQTRNNKHTYFHLYYSLDEGDILNKCINLYISLN